VPLDDDRAEWPGDDSRVVRDTVFRWVLRGRVWPGEFVSEDFLLRSTGATPAAVSEGLQALVALGVVQACTGGVVIAQPEPSDVVETDEVRHILEGVAVRRFVAHASDAQLEALGRAVRELERTVAADPSPEALVRARDWFFIVMLRGCAGRETVGLLQKLRVQAGLVMSLAMAEPGRGAEIATELRDIHRALAARDAEAAIAACDRHRAHATEAGLRRLALGR
jgi:DNA-binding GntR family transcriptional regulator